MKLIPWLVILAFGLTGCSGSKSAPKVSEETPQIELSDADEFIENPNEPAGDATELTEAPVETPVDSVESVAGSESAPAEEPVITDTVAEEPVPVVSNTMEDTASPAVEMSGTDKTYTVQKNETLMMVAFKLYGDYSKWKDIASQNRETLNGSTVVREGQVLKYNAPAEEFVWNPQGLPYLIKTGDTLGIISNSVYQTPKKWKLIWDNNRPLIKNPNLIFSGFTIYYLENGREVAAEL